MKLLLHAPSVAGLRLEAQKFLDETSNDRITTAPPVQENKADAPAQEQTLPVFPSSAPVAQVQVPPAAVVEGSPGGVDSRGFPWDERIHSSNFAKTNKGVWRGRRGVEPKVVVEVEQELLAKMKANHIEQPSVALPQVPAAAPVLAAVAPAPFAAPPIAAPQLAMVPPLSPAPPVAPPPLPVATPPPVSLSHTLESFKTEIIPVLGELVKQGKLTQPYVEQLKAHYGVAQIWELNDDQVKDLFESFVNYKLLTKVG